MWPFNRDKQAGDLKEKVAPTAVKEYYQAGGKQQTWVIWLLSIATFIVTLLIVLGLFWAGRWVWNQVTEEDQPAQTTQEQSTEHQQEAQQRSGSGGQSDGQNSGGSPSAPAPSSPGTPSPTSPNTSPSPAPAPSAGMPATGDSLPATGPTSDE